MSRPTLNPDQFHSSITSTIEGSYASTIEEISQAIQSHSVVVVGMRQNPVCKKVRKVLGDENIEFEYLEYGSYMSEWKRRLAIKMWSSWPTFPMVFVNNQLIGGCNETQELLKNGQLKSLLK